jgi:hypothetical protein
MAALTNMMMGDRVPPAERRHQEAKPRHPISKKIVSRRTARIGRIVLISAVIILIRIPRCKTP